MTLSFFRRNTDKAARGNPPASPPSASVDPDAPALKLDPSAVEGFVSYQWLLDPKKAVIGYRLAWQAVKGAPPADVASQLDALVSTVAQSFCDLDQGWTQGKLVLMFSVTPQAAALVDWRALPAGNIVLCWQESDFLDEGNRPLLQSLRKRGFGHMLSGDVPEDKGLHALITHYDVGVGDALAMAACRAIGRRPPQPIATAVQGWDYFGLCAAKRVPVLLSPTLEPAKPSDPSAQIEPETLLIVRLMQMVQRNEDIREIEAALRHDAALMYRLLRHISSPGVGAGVQIDSLKHAVAMLGYSPLFRWLSMLLATTSKHSPPFMIRKAIVRGRFVELLGHVLLGPGHADNLFLVGMFSVIDRLLGLPVKELFQRVQLSDAVKAGVLERSGIYGPFLSLAQAAESGAGNTGELCEQLFLSPSQVNAAHLGAIAWAQDLAGSDAIS